MEAEMGGEQPSPTLSPAELSGWLTGAENTVATTRNTRRTCRLLGLSLWTCSDTHESSSERHRSQLGEHPAERGQGEGPGLCVHQAADPGIWHPPSLATSWVVSDPSLGNVGGCVWDCYPGDFALQSWARGTASRAEHVHTGLSKSSLRANSPFQPLRKI